MHTGTGLAGVAYGSVGGGDLRLFGKAVLCSLALHALILLFLSWFREGSPLPPPPLTLVARLVKPKPPPEPPKAEPLPPAPRAAPAAKPASRQPSPAPTPLPVLAVEPAKQAVESAPVVPSTPAAAAPSLAAPAAAAATVRSDAPPAAAASGPDPGSVARFRLELMDIARRYKRYPRIAQDNNWEGRVELRIAYAANGSIASLTVKKGAGRQVLDDEAQAMIRSAQARATIPPALRGMAFVLEIPVDFSLEESR